MSNSSVIAATLSTSAFSLISGGRFARTALPSLRIPLFEDELESTFREVCGAFGCDDRRLEFVRLYHCLPVACCEEDVGIIEFEFDADVSFEEAADGEEDLRVPRFSENTQKNATLTVVEKEPRPEEIMSVILIAHDGFSG
jgi:hypothetical protein